MPAIPPGLRSLGVGSGVICRLVAFGMCLATEDRFLLTKVALRLPFLVLACRLC